ncbi:MULTISPECIES: hypothetical protein [unclassified Variovorax]|uniref:hypothetical protein n=1 Tax=unclassified Variovorax TaxID=663243 RepID=UPI00076BE808|nr:MULTISPECIES: hypothetical protein [unclassified Variovorax]KWT73969.1 hypothetical protein APY03_5820 [Variovorax sp. WDL1]PNG52306.1 hypothetical protein CHC07_04678 [Variovorax sp. B4]PNG54846.1 hypothetical protein CHC06_03644 [Variovorax sp. B2]VTV15857.1 hypothetical protein WDL1CHR_06218 [Variovorax sp. WDL1]
MNIDPNQKPATQSEDGSVWLSPAATFEYALECAYLPLEAGRADEQGRGRMRRLVAGLLQRCVAAGMPHALADQICARAALCRDGDADLLPLSTQAVGFLTLQQFCDAMTEAGMPPRDI